MEKKQSRGNRIWKTAAAFAAVTLAAIVVLLLAVILVLLKGPSPAAGRLFALSCQETSALKWVPGLFASDTYLQKLMTEGTINRQEVEMSYPIWSGQAENTLNLYEDNEDTNDGQIMLVDIQESLFKGKLMIIQDPKRVCFGVLDAYGEEQEGMFLYEFIDAYHGVGGTNAGGFYDPEGNGNGGIPEGIVISGGELRYGEEDTVYSNVIGLDAQHHLCLGDMTPAEALEQGIESAVSFAPGPVLVKDGVRQQKLGGGINPRTCIGQRADGSILLLVVEGRKPDSLGATYDDLAELMERYGAVNAANLDGGSSSLMYYMGQQLTRGSNIVGMRMLSTAVIVLPEGGDQNG